MRLASSLYGSVRTAPAEDPHNRKLGHTKPTPGLQRHEQSRPAQHARTAAIEECMSVAGKLGSLSDQSSSQHGWRISTAL
jgi:hypothetical protein